MTIPLSLVLLSRVKLLGKLQQIVELLIGLTAFVLWPAGCTAVGTEKLVTRPY
jgi:hypothetical protein